MATVEELVQRLQLSPLDGEGGLYRQTYQSADQIAADSLSPRYPAGTRKPLCTAIQYLVTPECFSRLHRLPTDEVYHFYLGDPILMLLIPPEGEPVHLTLGPDILGGMEVQAVVPAGWWQGSWLRPGGEWALVGTTMAPGYTDADYEDADPALLKQRYPLLGEEIDRLTAPAVFPGY